MLPTMFLSSPRSRRNSTRMPDSSVATRDSYGAELMTMSLFPFCTLSLPAGDEFGRQLLGREPVGGKRSPQDRPRGVERPGAFPGSMDDCNEEALSVHQEIGDQGFQGDLGSAPLLLHGHREFAGGAKGLPRLLHPIRGEPPGAPAGPPPGPPGRKSSGGGREGVFSGLRPAERGGGTPPPRITRGSPCRRGGHAKRPAGGRGCTPG